MKPGLPLTAALCLWLPIAAPAPAQTGPKPLANPVPVNPAVTNVVFQRLDDHRFQVGQVILHKTSRTVSFPAVVNMNQGLVEYFCVGVQGKVHESVLRTEVEPYHVHVAMLLLGAKGAPAGQLNEDYRKPVPGDAITLTVAWEDKGKKQERRAEELVWDVANQRPMSRGPWTYSGSRVFDGLFLAQRDRSFVAIIGDIDALVNNPRPRRERDDNWMVNTNTCPPLGTPVTLTFQLGATGSPTNAPPQSSP
ncbi:YdjY domain-containing protein [Fontisphaera persica]|uniref:YdjY domain-containing protein n=1 Tax=Fontisphaera persica TaxID=2974023 RepID=UPI0024C07FB9|nr:YdjY domain-containing protein [Fontisphaera persica]WCJ57967.1 YdjY domain-containing protein [Fontisphaera persica]